MSHTPVSTPAPRRMGASQSSSGNSTSQRLWSTREVSAYLGIPVATLHQWRYQGRGPDAYRVGRHLRYRPDAVVHWLDEQCSGRAS